MTSQERAVGEVAALLDATGTPYMIIGGLANIVWGEPRATLDIDVTVWVEDWHIPAFVERLRERFALLVDQPLAFVAETRVLPVESHGVRVDFIFGQLPFEQDAIARAKTLLLAGCSVRVCTPEDLILMKIVSDRERDVADAAALVRRRLSDLDLAYLEPRIEEIAVLLGRSDIRERWREWKQMPRR